MEESGDGTLRLGEDYRLEQKCIMQSGKYSLVGISLRGRLHIYNHSPREDALRILRTGPWIIVAVADGVGSCKYSRFGASNAVNGFCNNMDNIALKSIGLSDIVSRSFRKSRDDLESFAKEQGFALSDLHSTLLGLILNTETDEVGAGQIGDGLILGLTENGEAKTLIESDIPDDVGATYVLTQNDWEKHLRLTGFHNLKSDRIKTFYLMTDGVADDCQYPPPEDILKKWATQIDSKMRQFLFCDDAAQWLYSCLNTYHAKGNFDDRTLIIVYQNI